MGLQINFTKSLPTNEILLAYNNNIIEFESGNGAGLNSIKCEIRIDSNLYEIYPSPTNVFRFNFREAFQKILNQNHFSDDDILDVTASASSCVLASNDNTFRQLTFYLKIYLENGTFDEWAESIRILKGVENIKNISDRKLKVGLLGVQQEIYLLTPFEKSSDHEVNLTYWEGFPFDVGFYSYANKSFTVSRAVANDQAFTFLTGVGRFIISDGNDTIEQFITLNEGFNPLTFTDINGLVLNLKKVSGGCGRYLKWINKYGHWNYWLFNNRDETQFDTKGGKSLFNDFDDLDDNISPYLEIGKSSFESKKIHSSNISEDEMFYLKYLFESPKVYLFTGEKDVSVSAEDWIEVKVKGQKIITDPYKGTTFKISATIELPKRNTMTL